MDALSPSDPCEEVVCKFSSQTGKTEIILNFKGFIVDVDPGPILAIQPTIQMAETVAKDRVAPMVRDTPVLREKIADPKSRSSGNTMLHKSFPGGHLTIGGSNSPAGLASRPIRYCVFDEVDRYETTKEGDAIALATKRSRTFFNRKILKVSSPTLPGVGIDLEYSTSTQCFEWQLECPTCGETQRPALKHFQWEKSDPDSARYVCEHCGEMHDLRLEDRIKASGRWVCVKNEGQRKKAYWMNQFSSPFARWSETITEFLDAGKDPEKLRAFINTALAETWEEDGDGVESSDLESRREHYAAEVPRDGVVLVCGVDTQDDRLEWSVIGFGEGEQAWWVDRGVIYGDPSQAQVWRDLDAVRARRFRHQSGNELTIAATCIDSGGHHTTDVYTYARQHRLERVWAIKGLGGEGKPLVGKPSKQKIGRRNAVVELFGVGTDAAKALIFNRLRNDTPGPGYVHFPDAEHFDDEFFAQLTAEKAVTKYVRGYARREWKKTRDRNEALDIFVYALAALRLLNPQYDALAQRLNPEPEPDCVEHLDDEDETDTTKPQQQRRRTTGNGRGRRRGGGYATSWKR